MTSISDVVKKASSALEAPLGLFGGAEALGLFRMSAGGA